MNIEIKENDFTEAEFVKIKMAVSAIMYIWQLDQFWERVKRIPLHGELSFFAYWNNNRDKLIKTIRFYEFSEINENYFAVNFPLFGCRKIKRSKLNKYNFVEIAGQIIHQHLHDIGCKHDFLPSRRRKHSLCFGVEALFVEMGQEVYNLK
jgi:hypothetical protein